MTTAAKRKSDLELTKYTPYLTLTGKLWGISCKDFGENWSSYNGTALYIHPLTRSSLVRIMACRLAGTKPLSEPMMI